MNEPMPETLDDVETDCVDSLIRAAKDRNSPFRHVTVASVDEHGQPQTRTMVVRNFEPEQMTLFLHTDARSPKVAELTANPQVQLLFWHPAKSLQLRVSGAARFMEDDDHLASLWQDIPHSARSDYQSRQPPGEQIALPGDSWRDETLGRSAFAVLTIDVMQIDWLRLSRKGHRRALVAFDPQGRSSRWLAP